MTKLPNEKEAFYAKIVGFFDQKVLASYKSEPDKYILETDYFEGHLRIVDRDEVDLSTDYINIQFGYRTCRSGDLALAVYLPDLFEKSPAHVQRWAGYQVKDSALITEQDSRFEMWKARYLEGSWDVENGPRYHLGDTIGLINALCIEKVGKALFKYVDNPALNFPIAQNTHAYQDVHRELYGYIIDGLEKETIVCIAAHQGLTLNINSDNTQKALKKALPTLSPSAVLWRALDKVSNERRNAGHGVRPPAQRFSAFEKFTSDLEETVIGLIEVLTLLENVFRMDGERARKRQQAKKWLPQIVQPPEAHYSINQIRSIIGKTVERVEYGFCQSIKGVHQGEAIILHFTDGSILGIDTGSNAVNVADDYEGLQPEDFHTDFMLCWVPAPNNSTLQ